MPLGVFNSAAFTNIAGVAVAANASVEVRRESDNALASLFTDKTGATAQVNPFLADANGRFSFAAAGLADGYRVQVTKDASVFTLRYVPIGAAMYYDASTFGASLMAAADAPAGRAVLGALSSAGGGVGSANIADGAVLARHLAASALGLSMLNGELAASVASNALTLAIKTMAGTDPSATDPVYVIFRDPTAASGALSVAAITAATSIVVSSGSTLGTANSEAFRFWVVGFLDGATFRLGVINCRSGLSVFPLAGWGIASSTAEGGLGAADSAHVFYTGTAVTAKPYTTLGYVTFETGLATAGTYAAAPTRAQVFGPGVPLPGHVVQSQVTQTGALATGTTIIPFDDTIPQSTEGDQYMSQAITPSSAANLLDIAAGLELTNSSAQAALAVALFQDSVANALATVAQSVGSSGWLQTITCAHRMLAATTAATTLKARAGGELAGTTSFNGSGGARKYGGVSSSYLKIAEVMA